MDDLVTFLRARLKEDADYARTAFADHNDAGPKWYEQWSGALNIGEEEDLVLTNDSAISRHMERHDPERVLAEVEAKLAIIDLMERALQFAEGDSEVDHYGALGNAEEALSLLARPFAGHPDYRDDWRP
ncbi:DUF6221 family protein [Streptomyces globisporus]|uniref:DUF6221 family protein n=1 Tax=Streptomyces globisporus TaxID=1908 RepID=UPI0036F5B6B4